ncbi:MAG TPA: D-aminoacylase, partial [Gemmatimonadetes bacterium]|nr:D-aminoacylase [Gemmatimonadota bacterium]
MKALRLFSVVLLTLSVGACSEGRPVADVLLLGGSVLDGSGAGAVTADVAVSAGRIVFVGDAAAASVTAADTVDVRELTVTPGFIDMHSHAELDADHGRDARAFLYQGITSVVLGVDGGGGGEVAERLQRWMRDGIGVNALLFVGPNA